MPTPRRHLGWLGPAIVAVGAAVAALGVWYMVSVRPVAGDVIETVPVDAHQTLVVRRESGGATGSAARAFVELREDDQVKWQALVPRYAGHPGATGLAWSPTAVSVRVVRDGYAELFALAMHDASKLGGMRLAPEHGPVTDDPASPVTLTDHARTYEVVSGPDWHQLVAIDLKSGKALWSRELGAAPVRAGGVTADQVWVDQAGARSSFAVLTGAPVSAAPPIAPADKTSSRL